MLRGMTANKPGNSEEGDDYEQQVQAWAWAIWARQAPVQRGFEPAPIFPVRPTFGTGCEPPGPLASVSLEFR
jgi:hypothetical protein